MLNEETYNPETGGQYWTHRALRRTFLSLMTFEKSLFMFEHDRQIPTTSNSIEGHFSHIDDVVGVHRGLSREYKQKILHIIIPKDHRLCGRGGLGND